MSNSKEDAQDNNLVCSKINNGQIDEEIVINEKDNQDENAQYYENNKLFNNENNFGEGELEEDSDDTIVAFQEEKNSNLIESQSRDNIFTKDSTNENGLNIEYEKEEKDNISENKYDKTKSSEINKNEKIKISYSNKNHLKRKKKKKKKEKHEKNEKIEIYAHDKKIRKSKLDNLIKKIKINRQNHQSLLKNNAKTEKDELQKKQSTQLNINQIKKNLSKSIKQFGDQIINSSSELGINKIIYENGVSDDEEEIKKILKKR